MGGNCNQVGKEENSTKYYSSTNPDKNKEKPENSGKMEQRVVCTSLLMLFISALCALALQESSPE